MAEENQDSGDGQKSSKILIIIIIVLLLVIAGGGAAFFMLGGSDSAEQGKAVEQTEQGQGENEAKDQSSKESLYYELEQPLRVNFPKGSSANLIEVKLAFLVENEEAEEALKKHEPMIVNNLLMAISATGADKLKLSEGKNELRNLMLEETGKVMEKMTGKNSVREVFFTAFVMQ